MELIAKLIDSPFKKNAKPFAASIDLLDDHELDLILRKLNNGGCPYPIDKKRTSVSYTDLIAEMSDNGFIEYKLTEKGDIALLRPVSMDFRIDASVDIDYPFWKVSRFMYMRVEDGKTVLRNPKAFCELIIEDANILKLIMSFNKAADKDKGDYSQKLLLHKEVLFYMLVKAQIIYPCDEEGLIDEEKEEKQYMWDFHDLLFHSSSRLGRNGRSIGGTFRFHGKVDQIPPVKNNPWLDNIILLPKPDLASLYYRDMPLTMALETRRSIRNYSPIPLTVEQLGEFLFRTLRIRYHSSSLGGETAHRLWPGGGAIYEDEFYLTVDNCGGIPKGFYYYDPVRHGLCLISEPCKETAILLNDAYVSTANIGRPQILISIASRFNRFNWKYEGMSYAAQLKNIGAIYQTLYLVATAMNIGASGLGIGNPDTLCKLTGQDYMQESSIGEFMIGRPY